MEFYFLLNYCVRGCNVTEKIIVKTIIVGIERDKTCPVPWFVPSMNTLFHIYYKDKFIKTSNHRIPRNYIRLDKKNFKLKQVKHGCAPPKSPPNIISFLLREISHSELYSERTCSSSDFGWRRAFQ